MKTKIRAKRWKGEVWWDDKPSVNKPKSPVKDTDYDLYGGGYDGGVIFNSEEVVGKGARGWDRRGSW